MFGAEEHARQVDSQNLIPIFERILLRGAKIVAGFEGGSIEEDVDTPEFLQRPLHGGLHGALVGNISDDGPRQNAKRGGEVLTNALRPAPVDVHYDNPGPELREGSGKFRPQNMTGPGQEGHSPTQVELVA